MFSGELRGGICSRWRSAAARALAVPCAYPMFNSPCRPPLLRFLSSLPGREKLFPKGKHFSSVRCAKVPVGPLKFGASAFQANCSCADGKQGKVGRLSRGAGTHFSLQTPHLCPLLPLETFLCRQGSSLCGWSAGVRVLIGELFWAGFLWFSTQTCAQGR